MKRLFKLPLSRKRLRPDVDAELSFHLEGRVEELMVGGLSREEAEREALRRFGDRLRVGAEVERIDKTTFERRAMRQRLEAVWRDVRYAGRGLARRPLYSFAVVLTLALGIGANTAIFSVVETVMLKPLPVRDIGRLAVVNNDYPLMNLRRTGVSPLEAIDLFKEKSLFTTAAAWGGDAATIMVRGEATRASGARTLGEFWRLFGERPLLGRVYRPEDSEMGRSPVIVLSHALWQQISGDSAIVGRTVVLDGNPVEVIGVMPADFAYPRTAQYWKPFALDTTWLNQTESRGTLVTRFVGRMTDGMTVERLGRELRALADRWHATYTTNYRDESTGTLRGGHTLLARSFVEDLAGSLKQIVVVLFVAVTFVLLIACANVAGLQLVRSAGRVREMAVRAALGAGRAAIARQLIVESALLALAGGVAGVALGKLGLGWLTGLNVARFPALKDLHLDGLVLAFTAGTVLLAGALFGSVPAFRAARTNVNDVLRDAGRGSTAGAKRHRFLKASVVVQNALTLLLLVSAALTIRSLDRLLRTDPGFEPQNVLAFTISLPRARYPGAGERLTFFRTLDERLKGIPGVQAVGFALGVPFTGAAGSTSYKLASIPRQPGEPERHADQAFVFGDFFKTMGIQIVRGRAFNGEDYASSAHTLIVDETLVRQSFGKTDPIGVQIEHGPGGAIVGVARRVRLSDLTEPAHPLVYHNYAQTAGYIGALTAVVRSTLPPDQISRAARAAVSELDPTLPLSGVKTLGERVSDSLGVRRLATYVLAAFAAVSFVLALLGVYAVMSYVVSERTKEIGIRVALGAHRGEIVGMVFRDGGLLATLGLIIGAIVFVGLGKLLRSLIYGVGMLDPIALGLSVLLLAGVTLLACYFPARRAMRVDPAVTLRSE